MTSFRWLSTAFAGLCFALFACLLLYPAAIYSLLSITSHDTADILARRASMLFLGFAALSYLGRNAATSDLRQAVMVGMFVTMLGLLSIGVFEWVQGRVGLGIWVAIVGEALFCFWTITIWLEER